MDQNQDDWTGSGGGRLSDRALSIAWIAVFLAWLAGFAAASTVVPEWMLLLIVFASLAVGAGVLHLVPPPIRSRVSAQVNPAFLMLLRFLVYISLPGAAYTVVRWVGASRTYVRLPGLVVLVLLLAWMAVPLTTERRRRNLLKRAPGTAVQLDYAAIVILLAAGVYSAVTLEMVRAGWVEFRPVPKFPGELADFYLWHLVDSIPGELLTTLRVDPPFTYTSHVVGGLVYLFKLTIIVPVIAWVGTVIKVRREPE